MTDEDTTNHLVTFLRTIQQEVSRNDADLKFITNGKSCTIIRRKRVSSHLSQPFGRLSETVATLSVFKARVNFSFLFVSNFK